MASALPFDILYNVFSYCVEFDHPSMPLEALLLVCKSWLDAAIGHNRLWSTFDISITLLQDITYWVSCIKRRLVRGSMQTLLDIEITRGVGGSVQTSTEISSAWESLLNVLTGQSGEVSIRWRRFVIEPIFIQVPTDPLVRSLSFPTPKLEEFRIYGLKGDYSILPDTRSLKIFDAVGLVIPQLPNLTNVTDLTLYAQPGQNFDEKAVSLAVNVTTLTIRNWRRFKLAAMYSRLQSLYIESFISENSLTAFSSPNLNELILAAEVGSDYLHVVSCKGIDLGGLKSATIGWPYRIEDTTIAEYMEGVRRFLMAATNLERLELWHGSMAMIVFKLLTDQCASLYQSRVLRIIVEEHEMELGIGGDRLSTVIQFGQTIGYTLDCSWGDIFSRLAGALEF